MGPEDYTDVDAMYEARTERDEAFDDFDSEVTCEEYYDDSMDGDHDSAMASAGWGTEEDYGYHGDE
jgi:hypothetical protein